MFTTTGQSESSVCFVFPSVRPTQAQHAVALIACPVTLVSYKIVLVTAGSAGNLESGNAIPLGNSVSIVVKRLPPANLAPPDEFVKEYWSDVQAP